MYGDVLLVLAGQSGDGFADVPRYVDNAHDPDFLDLSGKNVWAGGVHIGRVSAETAKTHSARKEGHTVRRSPMTESSGSRPHHRNNRLHHLRRILPRSRCHWHWWS